MLSPAAQLALLVAAAFSAGLVDAIGGGGGLITVPALFTLGLGPHVALGTNKGQACFGAASSLATYVRKGGVDRERIALGLASGFLGSLGGALLVLWVPPGPLKPIVLVLLALAYFVMLFRERLAKPLPHVKRSRVLLAGVGLVIGAYDGFFGPGTGTLLIVAFTHFFGDLPTRASGNAKIVNFGSNLAALIVFQSRAAIIWKIALPMSVANVLGAALGARLALRHGDRVVRGVVLFVLVAVALKVLFAWICAG
jgi:uncharacterized membrane protein YfcA